MSNSSRLILCHTCGTHRLALALACPSCEAPTPVRSSRSKILAAALGVSLTMGVGITACERPTPQGTIYGGPPIEEPVLDEVPGQDAAPDAGPDLSAAIPPPTGEVYGAPPVDLDEEPAPLVDEPITKQPIQEEVNTP